MSKKTARNTKGKIISAAWKLFYENGYEETTIEEIVEESETSKGSFYHYFDSKDELLNTLSYLFDEKYESIVESGVLKDDMNSFDKLMLLNKELFLMIENSISLELLARLYSTQLITKGERALLDTKRTYYKLLKSIISDGQTKGELREDLSINEIVKSYALMERALMYDWCICNGDYSLYQHSEKMLPIYMSYIRK